jgi:hypothetical protein
LKANNIPEIVLSDPEKIWLQTAYNLFKNGEELTPRTIMAKCHESLPTDFEPKTMDNRIVMYGANLCLPKTLSALLFKHLAPVLQYLTINDIPDRLALHYGEIDKQPA